MPAIATDAMINRKQQENKKKTLHFKNFGVSEYTYARFSATLPLGVTLEDAMEPEFWVHVASLLQKDPVTGSMDKTGSIIEVRTQDHSLYAELYVQAVQSRGLVVKLLSKKILAPIEKEDEDAPFKTRWNVGKKGFDIIRQSDKEIVGDASEFPTKELAKKLIDDMVAA